jgi:predicted dehydrogenase
MGETLRWGILGTGAISHQFAPDIGRSATSVLSAVCSRDPGSARRFSAEHGGAPFDDYSRFLDEAEVDVVYIATPAGTHHRLAATALAAGRNVVVEKPIATSAAEVADLGQRARAAGRFVMEAMWMRFSPAHRRLLELIAEGAIGEVRSVQASFGASFPRGVGSRWSAELGGSALLDQGIYPVTLAQVLLGAPREVAAHGTMFAPRVDATAWIDLSYDDPTKAAQLACSMVQWIDPSASVNGTDGYIRLDAPFWATSRLAVHAGTPEEVLWGPRIEDVDVEGNGFVPMIRSVNTAIIGGLLDHPIHPLDEAAAVHLVLEQVRADLAG